MKKFPILLFLVAAMQLSYQSQAQTQVKGRVIDDSTGIGLPDATVILSGTSKGTTSGPDGIFILALPADGKQHTVQVSHTGYTSMAVPALGDAALQIRLKRQAKELEDVVVIGYQTVRRRDLLASVSSVSAKDLKDIPLNSAEEALAGRLAGVQVTGSEGSPNAQVLIRVRGGGSITQDNSPLYVVDGMQIDNALSTLSPQDIESIDVLKDAAATSIYGARGANGVVIITTKGGKNTHGRTIITYNGSAGFNKLSKRLNVMDPYNYNLYQYERALQANDTATLNGQYPNGISSVNAFKQTPFHDWQTTLLGRSAFQETHNINLAGGTEQTQYDLSVTDNRQDGIMLLTGYERKLVSFRFDHVANEHLKIGFNVRYNNTTTSGAGTSNPGTSSLNFLRQIIRYRPYLAANQSEDTFDPSYYNLTAGNSLNLVNPVLLNIAQYRKDYESVLNLNGYINYSFTKFLSFRSTFGYNYDDLRQDAFDDTLTTNSKINGANLPIASINTMTKGTINNSNVFSYSNAFGTGRFKRHNDLNIIAGEETYQTLEKDDYIETRYFPVGVTPDAALANMNLGSPPNSSLIEPKPTSFQVPTTQFSFFSRVNYARDNKYLASVSVRADGSSLFGPKNRWGYFPSASAAWRISKENFFNDVRLFDDLKIRGSIGEAGNNRITPFLYLTQFATSAPSPSNSTSLVPVQYGLDDILTTGYAPVGLTNPDLKWETTISRDLGIDASMFKGRLQASIDVYDNTTRDLLVNVPVPSTSGYTTQIQNVGSTSNKGAEIQLSGTVLQKGSFTWTSSFNISFNSNKIVSLGGLQKSFLQNSNWAGTSNPPDFIVKVGQPVGSMWGLVNDGYYSLNDFDYNAATRAYTLKAKVANDQSVTSVIPEPGGVKFKDLNGDGLVTSDSDRTILGNAQPKFFGGLNQQFTYKNFDLSIFINFQYGNKVYNYDKLEFSSGYTPGANLLASADNRWKTIDPNTGVVYQQIQNGVVIGASPDSLAALNKNARTPIPLVAASASAFQPQSSVVEDGSFIRINNITLGYTLPFAGLRKAGISKLRIYATVNNLATITGYSGYDPEVNTRRATPLTPGVDYSAYPRSRAFIAGVNVIF